MVSGSGARYPSESGLTSGHGLQWRRRAVSRSLTGTMTMRRFLKRLVVLLLVGALTLLAVRIYDSQRGPPLALWHTYVPTEMGAAEIDAADWRQYLAAEDAVFADVRTNVTEKLDADDRIQGNRYFEGSANYAPRFAHDWNRSYVLEPVGPPVGAAVLLHGLTDSPYSQRHVAELYRARGFVAVVIRLPAHGTVPAALSAARRDDWMAATRLAVREARRLGGASVPLHLVGYSNGGALALKYALDALDDPHLARPDRVVLISPMIGVTRFARFAGLAAIPALFPAFAKAAWLGIVPEFNPFKYNSFPVNAATQSHRLTDGLQQQMLRAAHGGQLAHLAPVLTFQSVVDFTVSTQAIISVFYDQLPSNGSELVLFDINRSSRFSPLLRDSAKTLAERLLSPPPRRYQTTLVTNGGSDGGEEVERLTQPGATIWQTRPLSLSYPTDVYSLSHIALPFPMNDALYGLQPDPGENFGIALGNMAARGENGTLIVNKNFLLRLSSNPFFPYMLERIDAWIGESGKLLE